MSASLASGASAFNVVVKTFTLPSDFINPVLDITTFAADDRAVMFLNRNIVASTGIFGPGLDRWFSRTEAVVIRSHSSMETPGHSAPITFGFVAGLNALNIVVNNTHAGIFGGFVTPSFADPTSMTFEGTVTLR